MRILITGSSGFIGHSLVPKLRASGHDIVSPSREDCDLSEQSQIRRFFKDMSVDAVFHLAAKVGGIMANRTYPADFIYDNMGMNTIFLEEMRRAGIKRVIYPFCGCSFAKNAPNPIKEEYLFHGLPDESAMFYSLSKAANHLQLVAYRRQYNLDWVSVIPGNAYGPFDNFSETNSHVIPGLLRRFHFANQNGNKRIVVWGSGAPVRDFIYVDDVADGMAAALGLHHEELPINISSGIGVSIKELVGMVADVTDFHGEIIWDRSKPDGHMVKIFDVSRMRSVLGFEPKINLGEGLKKTYGWLKSNLRSARIEG